MSVFLTQKQARQSRRKKLQAYWENMGRTYWPCCGTVTDILDVKRCPFCSTIKGGVGAYNSKRSEKSKLKKKVTKAVRELVYARDGYRCLKCDSKRNLTIDHIKPRSDQGTNDKNNLQTLCKHCNNEKGGMTIDYRVNREVFQLVALSNQ